MIPEDDWAELLSHYDAGTPDERATVLQVCRQMHGKGRKEYGPLVLSGDQRNWFWEAALEVFDALFYVAVGLVKLSREWQLKHPAESDVTRKGVE